MRKINKHIVFVITIISIALQNCVEPFDAATESFENLLVVEATITNEFKYHQIKLSKSYRLEDPIPNYPLNASVKVIDDIQNTYLFQLQDTTGLYVSIQKFAVQPNRSYQLLINSNGKSYESIPTTLTNSLSEYNITAIKETNKDGIEGIMIYADSSDPSGNSKYYRFQYEETYKIIAPYWSPLDGYGDPFPLPNPPPYHEVFTRPRIQEEKTCYKTTYSNKILQTNTDLYAEDRVVKYPVLFLPKDDFKITHRYSILVRQLIQSQEAYAYYKTLDKFSGIESVFSQKQQGFIQGNMYVVGNPDKKVIGYFEVSSAKTKRIFFNFEDFFPNENKPPYITECNLITPDLDDYSFGSNPEFSPLIKYLQVYDFKFVGLNDTILPPNPNKPFIIVERPCGDCTTLGSNIRPNFWID